MLKTLIAGGRFDPVSKTVIPVSPPLDFANILYPHIKEHLVDWATCSSSFVVLALLETKFDKKDEVLATLKKNKKALQKAATEETVEQQARREELAVLKAEEGKEGKTVKKGKKKPVKVFEVGNAGSRLLLKLL